MWVKRSAASKHSHVINSSLAVGCCQFCQREASNASIKPISIVSREAVHKRLASDFSQYRGRTRPVSVQNWTIRRKSFGTAAICRDRVYTLMAMKFQLGNHAITCSLISPIVHGSRMQFRRFGCCSSCVACHMLEIESEGVPVTYVHAHTFRLSHGQIYGKQ